MRPTHTQTEVFEGAYAYTEVSERAYALRIPRPWSSCRVRHGQIRDKPSTTMQAMVLPAATFSVHRYHSLRDGQPAQTHEVYHICSRDDGIMIKIKPATLAALQPGSRPVDREAAFRALKKSCNKWRVRGAQAGAAPRAPLPNAPSQRRDVMTGFKCASRIVVGCIGYASQPLPCSMLLRGSTFCQHQRVFTIPRRTNLSWHM